MGNLTTVDYVYGAGAAGLVWYGMKKSGAIKWLCFAAAAYAAYTVYTDY